jgi:hypothetical protein
MTFWIAAASRDGRAPGSPVRHGLGLGSDFHPTGCSLDGLLGGGFAGAGLDGAPLDGPGFSFGAGWPSAHAVREKALSVRTSVMMLLRMFDPFLTAS